MRTSITFLLIVATTLRCSCGWAATVTTTADSGAGSLRDAISSATAGATINFAISGPITLTTGELLINKNLTLLATNLTVQRSASDGTPNFRIFKPTTAFWNWFAWEDDWQTCDSARRSEEWRNEVLQRSTDNQRDLGPFGS